MKGSEGSRWELGEIVVFFFWWEKGGEKRSVKYKDLVWLLPVRFLICSAGF
jgi:hypothetical protein